jgi:hypothetical protein
MKIRLITRTRNVEFFCENCQTQEFWLPKEMDKELDRLYKEHKGCKS